MQGVCFESIEQIGVRTIPDPVVEASTDAIVRVRVAGLCGSDLHPFFGREKGIDFGTVMGHEFVGEVVEVGSAVKRFASGDSVCAPFTTSCGKCFYCQQGITSRCTQGQLFGWRESSVGLHGGQSEFVRVPLADGTLMKIPNGMSDDVALLLGDNLSTGFYCAEMANIQPDSVCVVIGCGTVGLLAVESALRLIGQDPPTQICRQVIAIDPMESRLEIADRLGAITFTNATDALDHIMRVTD